MAAVNDNLKLIRDGWSAKLQKDHIFLSLLLLLALLHGLLYLFIVPPWQHYDEPGRFEHAWLIANRAGLPEPGDEDLGMRRELLASMIEHDFFKGMAGGTPPLIDEELPYIGISQLHDKPLYYWLAALPMRLLHHADITLQLYAGRSVSLFLYLISILLSWVVMGELFSTHPLRRIVPAFMVALPSYTDVMTMVGDDVGAVVIFLLFLWGGAAMISRGFSPLRFLGILIAAGLCMATKNTIAVAPVLVPFILLLTVVQKRIYLWFSILTLIGVVWFTFFTGRDVALWERRTLQIAPTASVNSVSPWGKQAVALESTTATAGSTVRQFLPPEKTEALQGKTVTAGAWVWTTQPGPAFTLGVIAGGAESKRKIDVNQMPTFHAITTTVTTQAKYIEIVLHTLQGVTGTIYYDGMVMIPGDYAYITAPLFVDDCATAGTWGDREFTNYLRNGSAEYTWPHLRSWVEPSLRKYVGSSLPAMDRSLASVLDWKRSSWIYLVVGRIMFQTFWARFGWAHVGLPINWYWLLGIIMILAGLGAFSALLRGKLTTLLMRQQNLLLFLLVAGGSIWSIAFWRVHPVYGGHTFIPGARYAFPALLPVALALSGGWWSLAPKMIQREVSWIMVGLTFLLSVASLWTIVNFYYW